MNYKTLCYLVFTLMSVVVHAQESDNEIELKINESELNTLNKSTLKYGQQGFLKFTDDSINIGLGFARAILLEVPELVQDSLMVDLSSFVYRHRLFYPIIIKLTEENDIQEIIQSELNVQGGDMFGQQLNYSIKLDSLTKYMLVTTDPELVSQPHYFEYEETSTSIIDVDGAVIPVYDDESYVVEDMITFTDKPKIKVMVPFKNGKLVYRLEQGFYFGMGAYLGGEEVEKASEEQYFRAGGGAAFPFGYCHPIASSRFVARYGMSFRFQTGEFQGEYNLGLASETVLTYQMRFVNIGLGGQYDFANTIKAAGETYKFNPVFSPKVVLEGRLAGYISIGGEYVFTDFKTDRNELFYGDRFGIFIRIFVGK